MLFAVQIFRICKCSRFTASCGVLREVVGRIIDTSCFTATARLRNASIMGNTCAYIFSSHLKCEGLTNPDNSVIFSPHFPSKYVREQTEKCPLLMSAIMFERYRSFPVRPCASYV